MRVPQVRERIKEAPAQALRGVFAGIGQLLLITDKLRNKTPARQDAPPETVAGAPAAPEVSTGPAAGSAADPASAADLVSAADPAPAADSAPAAAPAAAPAPAQGRDFSRTGNVRLLGEGGASAAPEPVVEPAVEPVVEAVVEPVAEAAEDAPPLPNYGELSVASLRARLRNLDIAQVRALADYERAHAARAEVIGMFERRIAKLEAGA